MKEVFKPIVYWKLNITENILYFLLYLCFIYQSNALEITINP